MTSAQGIKRISTNFSVEIGQDLHAFVAPAARRHGMGDRIQNFASNLHVSLLSHGFNS